MKVLDILKKLKPDHHLVEGVQLSFELRLQLEEGRALREVGDEQLDGRGDVCEPDFTLDNSHTVLLVQVQEQFHQRLKKTVTLPYLRSGFVYYACVHLYLGRQNAPFVMDLGGSFR